MRPKGHCARGVFSYITNTRSPISRFLRESSHFWRSWRLGRYSVSHRRQNKSAKYWTWRQRFLYTSCFTKTPGGSWGPERRSSRWFGVSGLGSLGSSESFVMGRLFTMLSTVHMRVHKASSSRACCFTIPRNTSRMVLIWRSQTPPIWDAAGGLKSHSTSFCCRKVCILAWFHSAMDRRSSASAPTKLVPLSLRIMSGFPLRAMNRCKAFRNESVVRLCVTSMCMALVTRQVKTHP